MRKWIWRAVGIGVLAAALPTLFSMPPLKFVFVALLEKRLHTSVSIDRLNLSWLGPQKAENIRLENRDFNGTIQQFQSPLPFWSLAQVTNSFQIKEGTIHIHSSGYPPALVSQLHAVVQEGQIEMSATTTEEGRVGAIKATAETQKEVIKTIGTCTHLPTLLVDRLLGASGKLSALLGPSLDAKWTLRSEHGFGSLEADITSSNAQINASLAFTPQSVTLNDPLLLSCSLTPESSTALFKTQIQSQTPILLRIQPDGFLLSRPFSLAGLQIGAFTFDAGRFQIQNNDSFTPFFTLLKTPQSFNPEWINIWLTSVDAAYHKGVLRLGRIDGLLANRIHLCAWGDLLLIQRRFSMNLGLPADTLAQSFGISSLPSNYVLKIPLQGTFEKPELLTGSATAKIATMAATKLVPKPGPLGTFLNILNSTTDISSDAPAPKQPFPWER